MKHTLLLFAVLLFSTCTTSPEREMIAREWAALKASGSAEEERTHIQNLTAAMADAGAKWVVVGKDMTGKEIYMIDYADELSIIQSVNVTFSWGEERMQVNGWEPIDKDNIFVFFGTE